MQVFEGIPDGMEWHDETMAELLACDFQKVNHAQIILVIIWTDGPAMDLADGKRSPWSYAVVGHRSDSTLELTGCARGLVCTDDDGDGDPLEATAFIGAAVHNPSFGGI